MSDGEKFDALALLVIMFALVAGAGGVTFASLLIFISVCALAWLAFAVVLGVLRLLDILKGEK